MARGGKKMQLDGAHGWRVPRRLPAPGAGVAGVGDLEAFLFYFKAQIESLLELVRRSADNGI